MKTCSNCGQPIYEDSIENPAETLGALAEQASSDINGSCLCPACKKTTGNPQFDGFW